MEIKRVWIIIGTLLLFAACQTETEEAAPVPAPPTLAPPMPATQPVAQPQPSVVFASAEPQHGGTTQKIGNYMVELATGTEGKMDVYVQKHEGAIPSFEDVQLEMAVQPKDPNAEPRDVIFYPKDGKLQGTVAGLEKGAYDVNVKVFEIANESMAEHTFTNVALDPVQTELKPKHKGEVKVIDKTKMEVVRKDKDVKIWLRDLEGNKLPPDQATIDAFVVNLKDGTKETVKTEVKGDHLEAKINGDIDEETIKILSTDLKVAGQDYTKLRLPRLIDRAVPRKRSRILPTSSAAIPSTTGKPTGAISTIGLKTAVPANVAQDRVHRKPSKRGQTSDAKKAEDKTGGRRHSKKGGKTGKAKKAQ